MSTEEDLLRFLESINTDEELPPESVARLKQIAVCPSTPCAVLDMIAKIDLPDVLECLAGNPALGPELVAFLAGHPHPEVRMAVIDNPNATKVTLWMLARDESADVRYALAESHGLPFEVLTALVEDPNPYVSHRASRTLRRLEDAGGLTEKLWQWIARKRRQEPGFGGGLKAGGR